MIPALLLMDFHPQLSVILQPLNVSNFLFLGLGASACCFASWNVAVNLLGAIKTAVYIYLIPVISVISSALILQEQITPLALCGMAFTLLGLIISEGTLWQMLKQSLQKINYRSFILSKAGVFMELTGIVAEYNPFHNGHQYHLTQTNALQQADGIVAVISGNFTQRGEAAVFDKWTRAEMALRCGVDLVLELPVAFAVRSAAYFAQGALFDAGCHRSRFLSLLRRGEPKCHRAGTISCFSA